MNLKHTIMSTKEDRVISVVGEPGNYRPAFLTRSYLIPTNDDFEILATEITIDELTPTELNQYASLLEKIPAKQNI